LIDELSLSGFRIDAIKHFDQNFTKSLLAHIRSKHSDFFAVGENWTYDLEQLTSQLNHFEFGLSLFDFPLHHHFVEASHKGRDYDLPKIFSHTLVARHPKNAVTFVENHDTQRHDQILPWFKPLGYALILLREQGYPCVLYSDLYLNQRNVARENPVIARLLLARVNHAYGPQTDYFDHGNTIGWVRHGDDNHWDGLAVVLCTGETGFKKMYVGKGKSGQRWIDILGVRVFESVVIDKDGWGTFWAYGGNVSVWVRSDWGNSLRTWARGLAWSTLGW